MASVFDIILKETLPRDGTAAHPPGAFQEPSSDLPIGEPA